MEQLKQEITRRKSDVFVYRLIKRNQFVALYGQWYTEGDEPKLVCYEVFMIRRQKESSRLLKGKMIHYAEKELFPKDEDFGYTAWAINDIKRATDKFDVLTRRVHDARAVIAN